ncbi:MAG: hypothetical protein KDB16_19730, partial [Acidimicrobiales bacterium]|nr:hypothetical protein [Acidimicrobiales bacterium]
INPASVLPAITASVTIDGTTQAGAACDPVDGEHTIAVLLDGTGLAASSDGLVLTAGGSTIQGLAIEAFGDNQV